MPSSTAAQKSAISSASGSVGFDLRRQDVTRAVRQLELAEGLGVGEGRTRVEDPHLLVARVVVDDHLLGADYRRAAKLAGGQPRELEVRDHAAVVPSVDERDVRRARDDAGTRQGAHVGRKHAEPVAKDREIVGAEIPDDAHVGLVQAEIHPAHREEVEVAERTGVQELLDLHHGWAVEERVTRHQDEPRRASALDEVTCLEGRGAERLLDEDVLPGIERRRGKRVVGRYGGGDRDGVQPGSASISSNDVVVRMPGVRLA